MMGMEGLTDRELLLLVNQKVISLEFKIESSLQTHLELQLKVKELETKLKFYSATIAIASSFLMSLILHFISTT